MEQDISVLTLLDELCQDIIEEIELVLKEPNYQHEDEDWQVGLIMAEDIAHHKIALLKLHLAEKYNKTLDKILVK